ncbi:unnamed protein product [Parnassius mnemosyne]|uniref:Transposase Tc1-like domain-containing protein n=1 Tax=Parnassius mnemosyne TaxID=213953 RepID=A0AAV1LEA1_9NEOP
MPGSRRHMDVETATRAVFMLQEGESQRSVARRLGVSRRAIRNAWERFLETDSVARRSGSGSGRARATTVQEDRYIRLTAHRERTIPARVLQNRLRHSIGTRINDQTIRNRLHEDGQRSRSRVIRLKLTRAHRAARLRFAREHAEWIMDNWRNVLFTDVSKVKFFSDDRRVRVWRREGERFSEPCIHETDRFGGPNVMVWAGISLLGKTELLILEEGSITASRNVTNRQELINALKLCWERIPEENITHLIESVPDRFRECIRNRGGPTRY